MAVNRFFSSVMRIQDDRGQYVVTSGPYAAAAMLVVASLPFLLYRAITEDRVLLAGLAGYRAARVRWRRLPGLW
jgi:hypothetical protein